MKKLAREIADLEPESGRGYQSPSTNSGAIKSYQKTETSIKTKTAKHEFMNIHPEGHIETNWPKLTYDKIEQRLNANKDGFLPENRDLIKRFILDAKLGKTILKRQKKKVGLKRLVKYIQDLKKLDTFFNKPLDQVNQKDMEKFIIALEEGQIKTKKNKPYAIETQVVIKKMVKKFYKWLQGNNKHYPDLVEWIDTSFQIKDYKAITKDELNKILTLMTSTEGYKLIRNRALISFLFDTGARADEVLNIRLGQIKKDGDSYKVRIEFSKTKPRTISVPLYSSYLEEWMQIHPLKNNDLAQLFPIQYKWLHKIVTNAGKLINKKLSPHGLRHSSVSYYCNHLNRFQLCYRYGWSMSSKQPDRYIDREGIHEEEVKSKIENNNMEALKETNQVLTRRIALMEDQMRALFGDDLDEAKRIINMFKKSSS